MKASTLIPRGILKVDWKLSEDGFFTLGVGVPEGARIRVILPDGSDRGLCEDGYNEFKIRLK